MTDLSAGEGSTTPPDQKPAYTNSSLHVAAAGAAGISITQSLADVYNWLLTWPIHSPSAEQNMALAVLTVAFLGGGGFAIFGRKKS